MKILKSILRKINNSSQEKHFSEVFKGSAIIFMAKIIAVVFGLLSNLIIAKYYGAEVLGTLALITSFLVVACLFTTIGLDVALLRLIQEQLVKYSFKSATIIYFRSIKIVFFLGVLISIALWFSIDFISSNIYSNVDIKDWLYIVTFLIVISSFQSLNTSAIRAFKKVHVFALIQVIQPLITIILLVIMTFWFYKPANPIFIYFISICVSLFISFIFVSRLIISGKTKLDEENTDIYSSIDIMKISWPMFLTSSMWVITSQVDILMLGAYSNAENVGIYSVVIRFGLIVSFILTSINMVLAPKFAELFYSNKHDSLIKVAQKSSKLIFYTTVPIVVLFILFGKNILNFFGADFVPGYEALVLISLGQFINSICGSVGYFMNMTGHQSSFNKIIIVSTLINVILNWLLIPRWGVTGAAFSSLISTVFWNFGAALFIKFKFKSFIGYIPFTLGVKKHDQH